MAENHVAVTVTSQPVDVVVNQVQVDTGVFITVGTVQTAAAVTVNPVNAVNVTAVRSGPAGNGTGMLLQDYAIQAQLPTWNGAILINMDNGNVFQPVLAGNVTGITLSGWPTAGTEGKVVLYIPQGATPYTVGWPGSIKWLGGITPQLTDQNGHVDIVVLTSVDAGATIYGFHVGAAA